MFKQQMAKFELNVKELPLGKLSAAQVWELVFYFILNLLSFLISIYLQYDSHVKVDRGFAVLEKISAAINQKASRGTFSQLCSEFYTVIPHAFGRRVPPIFDDAESVQQKKDMLSVLSDIALAQELTKKGEAEAEESDDEEWIENPIDKNYDLLKADVKPLEKNSEEWKVINTYLDNTMASGKFSNKLKLLEVFEGTKFCSFCFFDLFSHSVQRESEPARFAEHGDIVERKLLWHGTNVAVLVAILSTGLRIMPHSGGNCPSIYVSLLFLYLHYLLNCFLFLSLGRVGKGIYFASENSKSAGYVGCTSDNVGFMFLNEVFLQTLHIYFFFHISGRAWKAACYREGPPHHARAA
jgi:poly [ADP-ribose] polymerase